MALAPPSPRRAAPPPVTERGIEVGQASGLPDKIQAGGLAPGWRPGAGLPPHRTMRAQASRYT